MIEIDEHDKIFVLTGAGISAESGIPTFRSGSGLWEQYRIEDVCTPKAWRKKPGLVWEFYSARRAHAKTTLPNDAHKALAALETTMGDRFFLCTQNVDNLHEQAGSHRLTHIHGELFKSRCPDCDKVVNDDKVYRDLSEVGHCTCGAMLRPHIVFFQEVPLELDAVEDRIVKSTLLVSIGTSGTVAPANEFVNLARMAGARTVYIGLEAPENHASFNQVILGKAGEVVPHVFQVMG